jgi:hypothetical protein
MTILFSLFTIVHAYAQTITFYKTQWCVCCQGHIDALKKNGFKVKTVTVENIDDIKEKYKISEEASGCHTIIMGNYIIEGHVPIAAIKKVLKEKPNINGIALPGMPMGTHGMWHNSSKKFEVLQLNKDNSISVYGEFSDDVL